MSAYIPKNTTELSASTKKKLEEYEKSLYYRNPTPFTKGNFTPFWFVEGGKGVSEHLRFKTPKALQRYCKEHNLVVKRKFVLVPNPSIS